MKTGFWRALDRLGANGAAACDWRRCLGDEWEICRPFLKALPGHAETVVDPKCPSRRLEVVPDGEDGFLGIVADDTPDGPPLPLIADDVAPMIPNWQTIADGLGKTLGFTANRYETQGLTRRIGIAQNGGDPARPVLLCLPAGHFGDHGRIANDLAARRDATVLLPTIRWITPPIQTLASANGLTLLALAEHFTRNNHVDPNVVTDLAAPRQVTGVRKPLKPLFIIQPGWRWNMIRIVVAHGGRLLVSCDGQQREYRLPKTTSKKPGQALGILMTLAVKREWNNPPSDASDHESVRKNFHRLEQRLRALIPLPEDPFRRESGRFIPVFQIVLHSDLAAPRGPDHPD